MRKAINFFLVEHEAGDLLGFILAWCCYVPPFAIAIQTSVWLTLWLQSQTTVSGRSGKPNRAVKLAGMLLLGQLLNEALNLVLKNIIRQRRPGSDHGFEDYGMPSSHSQFMAFLAACFPYLAGEVVSALDIPHPAIVKLLLRLACYFGTLMVAFARVYLHYHHVEQVIAGLTLGFVLGALWKHRFLIGPILKPMNKYK